MRASLPPSLKTVSRRLRSSTLVYCSTFIVIWKVPPPGSRMFAVCRTVAKKVSFSCFFSFSSAAAAIAVAPASRAAKAIATVRLRLFMAAPLGALGSLDRVSTTFEAGAPGLPERLLRLRVLGLGLLLGLLLRLLLGLLLRAAALGRAGHGADCGALAGLADDRADGRADERPARRALHGAALRDVGRLRLRRRSGRVDVRLLPRPAVALGLVLALLLGSLALGRVDEEPERS